MSVFCSREKDLQLLQDAWFRVSNSSNPHLEIVVILGQPGLGKTRLVQEFFGWLSTNVDRPQPAGYWPDSLPVGETNSRLNPEIHTCNGEVSAPFLWFGFPLSATDEVAGENFTGKIDKFVTPHIDWLERDRNRATGIRRALLKSGVEFAKVAGKTAFERLSPFGSPSVSAGDLYNIAQPIIDLYDTDSGPQSQESIQRDIRFARVDAAVASFSELFSDDRTNRNLPICIVIDDAQYSDRDAAIVHFLNEMLAKAGLFNWPILFVITSWEHDWHLQAEGDYLSSVASVVNKRAQSDKSTALGLILYKLPAVADLAPLLLEALPGLDQQQVQKTLDHVSGHPRFLTQMIGVAKGTRNWFLNRDLAGPFSQDGFEKFLTTLVNIHAAVTERLLLAPDEVQHALCLSAMQDIRFVKTLTSSVAEQLELSGVTDGLEEAQLPYAFVEFPSSNTGEFVQKVFFDVARDYFDRNYDVDRCQRALATVLHALIDNYDEMARLPEVDRSRVALLAITTKPETIEKTTLSNIYIHLANLSRDAMDRFDYLAAADYAARIVALGQSRAELGLPIEVELPITVMKTAIDALEIVGDFEKANQIAFSWHAGMASMPPDPNDTDEIKYERFTYLGDALFRAGDYNQASGIYNEAVMAASRVAEADFSIDNRARVGVAVKQLAHCLKALSKTGDALMHYNAAAVLFQDVYLASQNNTTIWRAPQLLAKSLPKDDVERLIQSAFDHDPWAWIAGNVAWTLVFVVDLLIQAERNAEAALIAEEVLERFKQYHRTTNTLESKGTISIALERLADVAFAARKFKKAEAFYRECMTIKKEILATNPHSFIARQHIALISRKIGDCLAKQDRPLEAEKEFIRSRDIHVSQAHTTKSPEAINIAASAINRLANVYQERGNYELAEQTRLEGIRMLDEIPDALRTPDILASKAAVYYSLSSQELVRQRPRNAIAFLEESVKIARGIFSMDPSSQREKVLANTLQQFAEASQRVIEQLSASQREQAVSTALEALEIRIRTNDKSPDAARKLCETHVLMGSLLKDTNADETLSHFKEALRLAREAAPKSGAQANVEFHVYLAANHLGKFLFARGELASARELLLESLNHIVPIAAAFPTAVNYRELAVAWRSLAFLMAAQIADSQPTVEDVIELKNAYASYLEAAQHYDKLNPTPEAKSWIEESQRNIGSLTKLITENSVEE